MEALVLSVVLDLGGLVLIWFLLKARVAKALEIDGLLAEARKEARLLTIEINETTDRNITLLEDRLEGLRELLAEADRRMGVLRRETGRRQAETEVYSRLGRRPPPPPSLVAEEQPAEPREEPVPLNLGGPAPSAAVPLPLGARVPEVVTAAESVIPPRSLRERAIELHRSGFSADIIAARLGATISEIELLVSLEEGLGRTEGEGGA